MTSSTTSSPSPPATNPPTDASTQQQQTTEPTSKHRRPKSLPQTLPFPYALSRSDHAKLWAKKYRTEVAASSASLFSTFLAFPLDTIKTRLQTYNFSSFSDCVRQTYRDERLRGFWRGVWSPLFSITLVRTVSFSIYQQSKYQFDEWIYRATGTSPLVVANTQGAYPSLHTVACFGMSGMISGAVITAIACPFELTKNAQQISQLMATKPRSGNDAIAAKSYQRKGSFATAKQIIRNRGWTGLYAGVSYHLMRDTIGTGVYFMTYESVKQLLSNARGDNPTSPHAVVVAGGVCGLVSWACIFPIDTAKSRYQRNCLIQKKEATQGVSFFGKRMYRGLGVSMARSAIVNALFFSTFEYVKKTINKFEVDEDDRDRRPT